MLFQEVRGGLIKVVAKNHQFLGVEQAPEAVRQIQKNQGRLGVFWHTQGSGKSFSIQALQGKTCAGLAEAPAVPRRGAGIH
jgi:type I restriction enzyme R subunit